MTSTSFQAALDTIGEHGELYPNRTTRPLSLAQIGSGGVATLNVDTAVLSAIGKVYLGNEVLRGRLAQMRGRVASLGDARAMLSTYFNTEGLIIGFAGYTRSGGLTYYTEAKGITAVYDTLGTFGIRPILAADGAVSSGVLGLSGLIAQHRGIPALGYIPYNGMDRWGSRDHMVMWGNDYPDREVLVGATSDLLVCVGGSDGTLRELQVSMRNMGVGILLALRDYGPNSVPYLFQSDPDLRKAHNSKKNKRLWVCRSVSELSGILEQALAAVERCKQAGAREQHLAVLHHHLS